jgi:hypothetical protein
MTFMLLFFITTLSGFQNNPLIHLILHQLRSFGAAVKQARVRLRTSQGGTPSSTLTCYAYLDPIAVALALI